MSDTNSTVEHPQYGKGYVHKVRHGVVGLGTVEYLICFLDDRKRWIPAHEVLNGVHKKISGIELPIEN